jgi:N-acetylmuramoyl-L-alanine amidase
MVDYFQLNIGLATVAMEAGGESYKGKLAVAYVLYNRAAWKQRSLSDICFAPWQFSCWNTDSPTRANLDQLGQSDNLFADCLRAICSAQFKQEPDPTGGAVFYLNKAVVLKSAGKLPDWWDIDADPATEVVIGNHAFRCRR